jgi:hypothetical protein
MTKRINASATAFVAVASLNRKSLNKWACHLTCFDELSAQHA